VPRSLEKTIREVGPENVAAFIAEPVVGAALGAVPPVEQYFPSSETSAIGMMSC